MAIKSSTTLTYSNDLSLSWSCATSTGSEAGDAIALHYTCDAEL